MPTNPETSRDRPWDATVMPKGNHPFVETFASVVQEHRRAEDAWIAWLKSKGVSFAHPDDGWVNRETNVLTPCYPYFNLSCVAGNTIALGYHKKYRLCVVTEVEDRSRFGLIRVHFREQTSE